MSTGQSRPPMGTLAHPGPPRDYQCTWHTGCHQRFPSKRQLFKHLREVHGLRPAEGSKTVFHTSGTGARQRRRDARWQRDDYGNPVIQRVFNRPAPIAKKLHVGTSMSGSRLSALSAPERSADGRVQWGSSAQQDLPRPRGPDRVAFTEPVVQSVCNLPLVFEMYHGTSMANALQIMKEGFGPSSGGYLDKGVYLAHLDKARSFAENGRHGGEQGAIIQCRVSVEPSEVKVVHGQSDARLENGQQAVVVWYPGGGSVKRPEMCVTDLSKVEPLGILPGSLSIEVSSPKGPPAVPPGDRVTTGWDDLDQRCPARQTCVEPSSSCDQVSFAKPSHRHRRVSRVQGDVLDRQH